MTAQTAPRKSREDWLSAAVDLLVERGINAVQITGLAKSLGITRGSFYWHFKDRQDLLDAILHEWRKRNTGVMLEALNSARDLDDGLLSLFSVWVDHTRFDPGLDQAVRDWSRRAQNVAQITKIEDDARIQAIADFLTRFGFAQPEALIRARVIYLTQISYYAIGISETVEERLSYLTPYFMCFIGRAPNPKRAQAYIADYLALLNIERS